MPLVLERCLKYYSLTVAALLNRFILISHTAHKFAQSSHCSISVEQSYIMLWH